ncbi:MAG: DUF2779 domain-containing protein [Candidatus Absconditabacterales bacterium]
MYITKSLYKEFSNFPKLARWHINNKVVYQAINEYEYGSIDGATIGQEVEDVVKQLFESKNIAEVKLEDFKNFHQNYAKATDKVMALSPDVIYQGGFLIDDLFVKTDFLIKNDDGKYDLVEVKSINTPLTDTKIPKLKQDLTDDMSFQRYVLQKTFSKFSGKVYLYHLNKDYVKHGKIVPSEIIKTMKVTEYLDDDETIEHNIELMRNNLNLTEENFNQTYPFDGGDYFVYYGKEPEKGTIFSIPRITQSKKKLKTLLDNGKLYVKDLDENDIQQLGNGDEESTLQKFVKLYLQGEVVDKEGIKDLFSTLKFPLFFYDYETMSGAIPIFDGTSPRQQATVQYSMHIMDVNGKIEHFANIVDFKAPNNKSVIDAFIKDCGVANGTFIAWNKGFECGRNTESGEMYPEYKEIFERINANTFDLMEVFKKLLYFHKDFNGSASIKKVLPVLTDISYDNLEVGNGGIATALLKNIVLGNMSKEEYEKAKKDLLTYCEQDTRAMVEIYRKVLEKIK